MEILWNILKNLENVQIDALDLLVLLYYYLYYCITTCQCLLSLYLTITDQEIIYEQPLKQMNIDKYLQVVIQ